MKLISIITIFLLIFLSSCDKNSYPQPDVSQIEDKLEKNKNLGNAAVTYDITRDREEQSQDPRKKDEQNVYIDKNVNLKKTETETQTNNFDQNEDSSNKELTTVNELLIVDEIKGTGAEAINGKNITVYYTGKLTNGLIFDSSEGKEPFTFTLGAGTVIKGWDQGLVGMKVGGKRILTIPASLAYGDRATGSIPAGATLIFNVELLEVN